MKRYRLISLYLFSIQMKNITLSLGGMAVSCLLQYDEAAEYLNKFMIPLDPDAPVASVPDLDWDFWRKRNVSPSAYLEYSSLTGSCSDILLSHGRAAFHSVALRYRDKAWLISAGSGVGKTTQLLTLQRLYPGQFTVISGDRPILELLEDGGVFVHPSPWNGKEELFGAEGAPLAGIICLRRGEEDIVEPVNPRLAVVHVYRSVIHTGQTEEQIKAAAAFTEALLFRVPIWNMFNRDIPGSTKLLYDTVFEEEAFI